MTPNAPYRSKKGPFLENRQVLTPNRNSHELCSVSKKQPPFFAFSGSACVQHKYPSAPPPRQSSALCHEQMTGQIFQTFLI